MRRQTGSIQQLGPDRYRVRLSNGYHPITGKRDQPSRTVHGTYADAEAELNALRADIDATGDTPHTFTDLWDEWNATTVAQGRRKTTTSYTDRLIYERHIKPTLGQIRPADIRPGHLNRLYDTCLLTLSPSSVRKIHQQIGAVMQYGLRREYLDRNVARLAEPPRTPQRYPEAPTADEVNTVLNHMAEHDTETYLVYRLDATVGLRRNELPALRYGDVDLNNQRIRIHRSVDAVVGHGIQIGDTKTGPLGHGYLGLDDHLTALIARRRHSMLETALATGIPIDDILIFPSADLVTPQRPDSFSNRARRYFNRYPHLPRITLRHLRSFVATELAHDGHGVATAQAALRHSSSTTTQRHYVAARATVARDATRTVGARLQQQHRPHPDPPQTFRQSS